MIFYVIFGDFVGSGQIYPFLIVWAKVPFVDGQDSGQTFSHENPSVSAALHAFHMQI